MELNKSSFCDCLCPKWYLIPAYPSNEDIDQLDEIEASISNSAHIDTSNKPVVWVLGGPGSGKGVQCEKITAKYGFTHLSTGDMLRAEVEKKKANYINTIMDHGSLVPNEVVLGLLKKGIQTNAATTKGFLVDGYPREKSQAVAFEEAVAPPFAILFFEASDATLTQRLLGRAATSGRADDNITTIKHRLKTHAETKQALLDQYPNKIKRINAELPVDTIFSEVEKVMDRIVTT